MKQTFFEEGERAGHMLASIAKAQWDPSYTKDIPLSVLSDA